MCTVELKVNQSIYSTFIKKIERPNSVVFIQDSELQLFVLFHCQDFKTTAYNL